MTGRRAENAHIAMRQMIAKGSFSRDELRIIGEYYPGVVAEAANMCEMGASQFYSFIRANIVEFTLTDAQALARKIGMPVEGLNDLEAGEKARKIKRSTGPWGFWNVIPLPDGSGPYMARSWLGRLRLHVFYHSDAHGRDPHDHPWSFWTFPFTSYVEEVTEKFAVTYPIMRSVQDYQGHTIKHTAIEMEYRYSKRLQVVPAWRWNKRPAEHMHRVMGAYTGKCVYYDTTENGHRFVTDIRETPARLANNDPEGCVPQFVELTNGRKLVTIVWRTGFTRMWGFLKTRDGKWCWQDFRSYIESGGSPGPCE